MPTSPYTGILHLRSIIFPYLRSIGLKFCGRSPPQYTLVGCKQDHYLSFRRRKSKHIQLNLGAEAKQPDKHQVSVSVNDFIARFPIYKNTI